LNCQTHQNKNPKNLAPISCTKIADPQKVTKPYRQIVMICMASKIEGPAVAFPTSKNDGMDDGVSDAALDAVCMQGGERWYFQVGRVTHVARRWTKQDSEKEFEP